MKKEVDGKANKSDLVLREELTSITDRQDKLMKDITRRITELENKIRNNESEIQQLH